jgi:glycerol-3-phosphate O-acyltransferase/dihydroxyacetone phosphate acyltransferase
VTGRSRVPVDRPTILAANHGNALADVAMIVAKVPRFPHFLAAATWWKSPAARALFTLGGVVPIHRRRDSDTGANQSTFSACYDVLATGSHVCIFPEGEMHTEPSLLQLRTGAARIALSAAADEGIAGIALVAVGLVYESRGRFRSDAEIHFAEPIEIDEWVADYRADPAKAVRALTDLLTDRLETATVNSSSHETASLVNRSVTLALADEPEPQRTFARRNDVRRALAAALNATGGDDSAEHRALATALDAHERDLLAIGFGDGSLVEPAPPERARLGFELTALTPPAALGVVMNAPVLLGASVAGRRAPHEAWQATVKGVTGTLLAPVVWAAEYAVLRRRIGRRRAAAAVAAGALGGAAALAWHDRRTRVGEIRRLASVERERPARVADARRTRNTLRMRVQALVDAGDW